MHIIMISSWYRHARCWWCRSLSWKRKKRGVDCFLNVSKQSELFQVENTETLLKGNPVVSAEFRQRWSNANGYQPSRSYKTHTRMPKNSKCTFLMEHFYRILTSPWGWKANVAAAVWQWRFMNVNETAFLWPCKSTQQRPDVITA